MILNMKLFTNISTTRFNFTSQYYVYLHIPFEISEAYLQIKELHSNPALLFTNQTDNVIYKN